MKFNYQKYRDWRKEHEKLDDKALDIIEEFNNYKELDGMNYEEIWKIGRIIIKDWCDE